MDRELSIQSNVTHVKGVESGSINTIKTVMLCMSKVLGKEVQNGLTKGCNISLLITFLIFNGFSIRKKFWKAET